MVLYDYIVNYFEVSVLTITSILSFFLSLKTTKYVIHKLFSFSSFDYGGTTMKKDEYIDKYYQDWCTLSDDDLYKDEEKKYLKELYVQDETPRGTIIMSYDVDDNMFYYWTNRKDSILYPTLDTVAQKYAIAYHCKHIYNDYYVDDFEVSDTSDSESDVESEGEHTNKCQGQDESENKRESQEDKQEHSLFAKFKSYNKSNTNPSTKTHIREDKYYTSVKQNNENNKNNENNENKEKNNTNHIIKNKFHYKGTLDDWMEMTTPIKKYKVEPKEVDYVTFKLNQENEKKMKIEQMETIKTKTD